MTAVVLLHPLALAGAVWAPVAAELSGDFPVVTPDLHGPRGNPWSTLDEAADQVAAQLPQPVHLVGMSMGGAVAMILAARHPDRVRSLTLADTTAWYGPDAPAVWAKRAEQAARYPREPQLDFQQKRWFTEEFRAARPDEVDRVCRIFLRTSGAAHAGAARAMGELDARPLLAAIAVPTLVLVGAEDYATPPVMAERLAAGIPGADLHILPGLRHLSLIERPQLASAIRAFVP